MSEDHKLDSWWMQDAASILRENGSVTHANKVSAAATDLDQLRSQVAQLRDELTAANLQRDLLRTAIQGLRQSHYTCEDCWYSCPKCEEGCCDERREGCTCGADAHNAKIDAVLADTTRQTTPPHGGSGDL